MQRSVSYGENYSDGTQRSVSYGEDTVRLLYMVHVLLLSTVCLRFKPPIHAWKDGRAGAAPAIRPCIRPASRQLQPVSSQPELAPACVLPALMGTKRTRALSIQDADNLRHRIANDDDAESRRKKRTVAPLDVQSHTVALHIVLGIYCTSHYVYTKIKAEFLSNRDERAPLVASRAIRVRLAHFASYCYSCTARVSTRVLWPARPRSGCSARQRATAKALYLAGDLAKSGARTTD